MTDTLEAIQNAVLRADHDLADTIERLDTAWMEIEAWWAQRTGPDRKPKDYAAALIELVEAIDRHGSGEGFGYFFAPSPEAIHALFKVKLTQRMANRWSAFELLRRATEMDRRMTT